MVVLPLDGALATPDARVGVEQSAGGLGHLLSDATLPHGGAQKPQGFQ
jgi:hypothetical protein